MDLTLWIELILFVVLMGFSGFFSSSETALFSLNSLDLEQMRRDENPRLRLVERMLSEPRRLIVTILIGNEFVNVAASVISAAIVIRVLGAEHKLTNLLIMVPVLLLVGEITPKTLAIRNSVKFATFQSGPIDLFARLITPLRWMVRLVADWFTTLIVGKERRRDSIVTEDMVRVLAHEAVGDGVLDQNEAQYIDHIFDFGNKTLEDIMTPRSNVFFLPSSMPLAEVVAELRRTGHTKVPVYSGHRDNLVGILYARDLLSVDLQGRGEQPAAVAKFLREPYFVPESKPASELFHVFRRRKLSMAITVDEFGGVTGLVTMEDLLECIFGDIPSHSDGLDEAKFVALADGRVGVEAAMTLDQFNKEFGTSFEHGKAETIGGLLLNELGELPREGTTIRIDPMVFTVTKVAGTRILDVAFERYPGSPEADARQSEAAEGATAEGSSGDVGLRGN